jgi:hypothetical protein
MKMCEELVKVDLRNKNGINHIGRERSTPLAAFEFEQKFHDCRLSHEFMSI